MFNPEKLLGGLIRNSARGSRSGLGSLVSGGAALGLVGVAMEAVEHFMNKPQAAGTPPRVPGTPPPVTGSMPPPPPATGSPSAASPPPPPGKPSSVPPPAAEKPAGNEDAILLIRAMIAAANADGVIDQDERGNILRRLQSVELSPDEHSFIVQELLSPADLEAIIGGVASPELAHQVYAVSLMAIEVDTEKERLYLETLARRLGLDDAVVAQIHRGLELE